MTGSKNPSNLISRWALGWIPFWGYSFFVFWGAVLPPEEIPPLIANMNDKVFHGAEYFFLFMIAFNAWMRAKSSWWRGHLFLYGFVYCMAMGIATEWAQYYVPGRFTELADLVADACGAGIAMGLCFLYVRSYLRVRS